MHTKKLSKRQLKRIIREEKALMNGELLEEGVMTGTLAGTLIGLFRNIPFILCFFCKWGALRNLFLKKYF